MNSGIELDVIEMTLDKVVTELVSSAESLKAFIPYVSGVPDAESIADPQQHAGYPLLIDVHRLQMDTARRGERVEIDGQVK